MLNIKNPKAYLCLKLSELLPSSGYIILDVNTEYYLSGLLLFSSERTQVHTRHLYLNTKQTCILPDVLLFC